MPEGTEGTDLNKPSAEPTEPADGGNEPDEGAGEPDNGQPEPPDLSDRERQLLARAKKAEAKLKERKAALPGQPAAPRKVDEDVVEEIVHLRSDGFSRDEVAEIRDFAKAKGITISQAAKHPFILAGIDAMRAKAKAKAATPPPAARTPADPPPKPNAAQSRAEKKKTFLDKLDKVAARRAGRESGE